MLTSDEYNALLWVVKGLCPRPWTEIEDIAKRCGMGQLRTIDAMILLDAQGLIKMTRETVDITDAGRDAMRQKRHADRIRGPGAHLIYHPSRRNQIEIP